MATKRRYEDGCAAAHALDLIGERWALLVVRELLLGPKRFTDLRAGLPTISPNVLSQRLHELEQVAVVARRRLPPPASCWVYVLTEWGEELEPIIVQLGRWGARSPFMDRQAEMSVDSLILSLRTLFDPVTAAGLTAQYELRFGHIRFHAVVDDGTLELTRGSAAQPDAIIDSCPPTLSAVIYDSRELAEAMREGRLQIQGDQAAAERFLTLFALPEPAPAS